MALFDKFKKKKGKSKFNEYMFSPNLGFDINNDTILSISNLVAKNIGKLNAIVLKNKEQVSNELSKLLTIRPCKEITAYDFFYKLGFDVTFKGNFFAFLDFDGTTLKNIVPLHTTSYEMFEYNKDIYFSFLWELDKQIHTVPYDLIVHIKSNYNTKRFFAENPINQIGSSMQMLDETYKGIKGSIDNNIGLKGYIKYNNISDDEDLKKKLEVFKLSYYNAQNKGGLAILDNTLDFTELKNTEYTVPITQVEFFKNNILEYFGINSKILQGSFDIEQWTAFYETTLEPLTLNMAQEFTYKIYGFDSDYEIKFTSNRLENTAPIQRLDIANNLFDRGAITTNEYRELLYHSRLTEGGDERFVSLNYVNSKDQREYQLGKEDKEDGDSNNSEDK